MSLSEESSGDGILASRHVSPETNHHENNAMNTTLLCHNFTLEPDFISYLTEKAWEGKRTKIRAPERTLIRRNAELLPLHACLLCDRGIAAGEPTDSCSSCCWHLPLSLSFLVASAAYIAIVVPRATLVAEAIAQEVVMVAMYNFFCLIIAECGGPSQFIRRVFFGLQLVASAAYIAIVVPRATLVAEAIAQEVVMVAMYNFFCLIIAECGGPSQFIRRAGESRLETRVLPCCCWPCCIIPRPKIDKRSLTWLRCLVLQIPIVQGVLYVIILVLWAEDMMLYRHVIVFIQFFVAASILSGMWGVIMCVRAANGIGVVLRPKFVALQLVLIIVKLQCGLSKLLSDLAMLPCVMSLHPTVLVNVTQYTITIFEMLLLSIWAWRLYGAAETKSLNKVQKVVVAVLEEGTGVMDGKQRKEGVDNKSFNITDNKCEDKV
ncbi:Organic solute transporter subunit alpha [Papilio machaon]|uniref:Organic solute transporter subunit alpha n=1 Tax=Papilio machaon TaxID=76193 RepID=A0A194RV26_PAPMA|nr:Organic solute transporter subunit alpha [Papilio machaon]